MNKSVEKRFLIYLLICFAGAFVIGSCTSGKETSAIPSPTLAPEYMDLSWKTEQLCSSPCWYGLEIGKSTKEDLKSLVPTLSFLSGIEEIKSTNISDEFGDGKKHVFMWIPCEKPAILNCTEAEFTENILNEIILHLNYELTVAEVVAEIGPPDHICFSSPHPEMRFSQIYLKWVDRGFIMGHERYGYENLYRKEIKRMLKDGLIPGYLPIDVIYYYSQEELESRCTGEWIGLKE